MRRGGSPPQRLPAPRSSYLPPPWPRPAVLPRRAYPPPRQGPLAQVTAYVASSDGHTVVPVNTVTNKAGKPIKVGPGPEAIAITPDGKTAYVANGGLPYSDTVTPIRTATDTA